jgi:multiple sugar transport system substrate-binding protein
VGLAAGRHADGERRGGHVPGGGVRHAALPGRPARRPGLLLGAEEAPTDGYFAAARTDNPDGAKALLSYFASPEVQQRYITESGTSNLPTSPEVDTSQFAPIVQKGIELLNSTSEITQFFNRDSSDALQTTADAALTRFIADPTDIPAQLRDWQAAAEQVFGS